MFFPVQLAPEEFNYEKQQGLIFVSKVWTWNVPRWFRVGAKSPDDLDRNLDFKNDDVHLRDSVIEYITEMPKDNVTYYGVLRDIQSHFKAGSITS